MVGNDDLMYNIPNWKFGMLQRRSKPRHSKNSDTGTTDNSTPNDAEDKNNPAQTSFEQAGQEDGHVSPDKQAMDRDSYMPLSEDEVSLNDEEFIVPEDPVEQQHFKRRLIATAKSLKKKPQ